MVDLKDNFVNNLKKLECSPISKFLRFKMIWSASFDKKINTPNFVQKYRVGTPDPPKNDVIATSVADAVFIAGKP